MTCQPFYGSILSWLLGAPDEWVRAAKGESELKFERSKQNKNKINKMERSRNSEHPDWRGTRVAKFSNGRQNSQGFYRANPTHPHLLRSTKE